MPGQIFVINNQYFIKDESDDYIVDLITGSVTENDNDEIFPDGERTVVRVLPRFKRKHILER